MNYFELSHVNNAIAPLPLAKDGISIKYDLLVAKDNDSDYYYYPVISNNWLTLRKCNVFWVIDGFNCAN